MRFVRDTGIPVISAPPRSYENRSEGTRIFKIFLKRNSGTQFEHWFSLDVDSVQTRH